MANKVNLILEQQTLIKNDNSVKCSYVKKAPHVRSVSQALLIK